MLPEKKKIGITFNDSDRSNMRNKKHSIGNIFVLFDGFSVRYFIVKAKPYNGSTVKECSNREVKTKQQNWSQRENVCRLKAGKKCTKNNKKNIHLLWLAHIVASQSENLLDHIGTNEWYDQITNKKFSTSVGTKWDTKMEVKKK